MENDKQSLTALINKVWLGLRSACCSSSPGWSLPIHTHAHTHPLSASVPVLTDTASPLLIVLEQQLWQRLNLLHQQSHCDCASVRVSRQQPSSFVHSGLLLSARLAWGRKGGLRTTCVCECARVCVRPPLN